MHETIFCVDNLITDQKQLRDRTQHANKREANFHPIKFRQITKFNKFGSKYDS